MFTASPTYRSMERAYAENIDVLTAKGTQHMSKGDEYGTQEEDEQRLEEKV